MVVVPAIVFVRVVSPAGVARRLFIVLSTVHFHVRKANVVDLGSVNLIMTTGGEGGIDM